MKTIIAGSRDFVDSDFLVDHMWHRPDEMQITEVVSGGARGADKLGEAYGSFISVPVTVFPAKWKQYGPAAGPIRNVEMAKYADALIAFWDGKSKGTKHMIHTMLDLKKPVLVFRTDKVYPENMLFYKGKVDEESS